MSGAKAKSIAGDSTVQSSTETGKHGTYGMYARKKCRCDKCRAYQNSRVAKNRADRLASGRLNHGTRSARDAGCTCDSCLATRLSNRKTAKHNHITRDIKIFGKCPACDNYWLGIK